MLKEKRICKICGSDMEKVESYYVTLEDWQGIETFMTYYECLGNPKHKQYISIIKRELPDHNKIVNVSLMPF